MSRALELEQSWIKKEGAHLTTWDNGKGISWDFRRRRTGFSRIECGVDKDDNPILRAVMLKDAEWPILRKPRVNEIWSFALLAGRVQPFSSHTARLMEMADGILGEKIHRINTKLSTLNSMRSRISP